MKERKSYLRHSLAVIILFAFPVIANAATQLTNPLSGEARNIAAGQLVATFVQGVLGFSGIIATLFIIYGGVLIAFGSGNEQQFAKGKKTITFAIIGLLVSLLGFFALRVLVNIVNQVSGLT